MFHCFRGAWRLKDISTGVTDELKKTESLIQPDDPCNIQFSSVSLKAKFKPLNWFR